MIKLTWLGHASWLIENDQHRILLDPFLTDNPAATAKPEDFRDISHVLVSHGHFDHVADVAAIAKANDATVVAIFEIAQWFGSQHGIQNAVGMNIGGSVATDFGSIKMVPAIHSSMLPDGSNGGNPAGFVLTIDQQRIYFACDTCLFSDMKLHAHRVDVAVLPIGDLFTMGIDDSVAATKLIEPKIVLPTHYNTWPPIEQDAAAWADRIDSETGANAVVLQVGEAYEL
jgi:L-ascorbate metabolism protein UlaG (beta-lactamase superfamily)